MLKALEYIVDKNYQLGVKFSICRKIIWSTRYPAGVGWSWCRDIRGIKLIKTQWTLVSLSCKMMVFFHKNVFFPHTTLDFLLEFPYVLELRVTNDKAMGIDSKKIHRNIQQTPPRCFFFKYSLHKDLRLPLEVSEEPREINKAWALMCFTSPAPRPHPCYPALLYTVKSTRLFNGAVTNPGYEFILKSTWRR